MEKRGGKCVGDKGDGAGPGQPPRLRAAGGHRRTADSAAGAVPGPPNTSQLSDCKEWDCNGGNMEWTARKQRTVGGKNKTNGDKNKTAGEAKKPFPPPLNLSPHAVSTGARRAKCRAGSVAKSRAELPASARADHRAKRACALRAFHLPERLPHILAAAPVSLVIPLTAK